DHVESLVERELVMDGCGGVVVVTRMIDPAALDLEEEAVVSAEVLEGACRHLGERGHRTGELVVGPVVDGEGQVAGGEGSEPRPVEGRALQVGAGLRDEVAGRRELVPQVPLVLALLGIEMVAGAAEVNVEMTGEVLFRDLLSLAAVVDADREARGSGMGDLGGGDEAAAPPRLAKQLHEG